MSDRCLQRCGMCEVLKGASPSAVVPTEFSVYNSTPVHARLQHDPCRGDSSRFHSVSQRPGKNTRGNGTIAGQTSPRTPAGRCGGYWNLSRYMRPLAAGRAYGPLGNRLGGADPPGSPPGTAPCASDFSFTQTHRGAMPHQNKPHYHIQDAKTTFICTLVIVMT